jgi:hypothetical protein
MNDLKNYIQLKLSCKKKIEDFYFILNCSVHLCSFSSFHFTSGATALTLRARTHYICGKHQKVNLISGAICAHEKEKALAELFFNSLVVQVPEHKFLCSVVNTQNFKCKMHEILLTLTIMQLLCSGN